MEDNTEKREVNVANGLNVVDDVDVHTKPDAQSFIHLPNLQPVRAIFGFPPKINCLFAQVILNSRQDRRSQGPPLPPDVLARIQVVNCHPSKDLLVSASYSLFFLSQHITDIHNLPPLPNGARPFGPGPQIYPGPRRSPR